MCPHLTSSPPDVVAAMLSPSIYQWIAPFLILSGCGLLFAMLVWLAPRWARGALALRFSVVALLLSGAGYSYALGDRWGALIFQWHNQVLSQQGFMACQFSELDSVYYRAANTSGLVYDLMFGLMLLAGLVLYRAMALHRIAWASRAVAPD